MQLLITNKINISLRSDQATGPDGIPVKFIKLPVNVIDTHSKNIIIMDIDLNCYSESAKIAQIRPIFKTMKELKQKITDLLVSFIHF